MQYIHWGKNQVYFDPFSLLPQDSRSYSLARLNLPREGSAFVVHKLACWKLQLGTY